MELLSLDFNPIWRLENVFRTDLHWNIVTKTVHRHRWLCKLVLPHTWPLLSSDWWSHVHSTDFPGACISSNSQVTYDISGILSNRGGRLFFQHVSWNLLLSPTAHTRGTRARISSRSLRHRREKVAHQRNRTCHLPHWIIRSSESWACVVNILSVIFLSHILQVTQCRCITLLPVLATFFPLIGRRQTEQVEDLWIFEKSACRMC